MIRLEIGKKYTPLQVAVAAEQAGQDALARRIRANIARLKDFQSDGCSCWPDKWRGIDYSPCCVEHDIKYWLGGTPEERLIADLELAICICKYVGREMAEIMLAGVRAGGWIPAAWGWGYGRKEA